MKKMLFVVNPHSGKGLIKNSLLEILQIFSSAGYEVTVYPTKAERDGYQHILQHGHGYDAIVCSGGDGTLNETVAAVLTMPLADRPPIGYIPSGSTNDFAASLSIPKNMKRAAEHITKGKVSNCDVGLFNGRAFNYVAAFGAFTQVSYATPQEMKNVLGHQAYIVEAVRSLATIKPEHLVIQYEDTVVEDDFIYGMITNARSVGGMKNMIGPGVKMNDGLFEGTFIRNPKNPADLQKLLIGFVNQTIQDVSQVCSFKTAHVTIKSKKEISWVLDGEFGGLQKKVDIEVQHSAIRLFVIRPIMG